MDFLLALRDDGCGIELGINAWQHSSRVIMDAAMEKIVQVTGNDCILSRYSQTAILPKGAIQYTFVYTKKPQRS